VNREERVAKNEILFREVNERILQIEGDRWRVDPVDFMCECGDIDCLRVVQLSVDDYERCAAIQRTSASSPATRCLTSRTVVETHPHYLVVEKVGEMRHRAEVADPRR
jgi:hypothetical protein